MLSKQIVICCIMLQIFNTCKFDCCWTSYPHPSFQFQSRIYTSPTVKRAGLLRVGLKILTQSSFCIFWNVTPCCKCFLKHKSSSINLIFALISHSTFLFIRHNMCWEFQKTQPNQPINSFLTFRNSHMWCRSTSWINIKICKRHISLSVPNANPQLWCRHNPLQQKHF